MSDTSTLMAITAGTGAAAGAANAYSQAQAAKSEGEYQNQLAQLNSKMADYQAADAIKRGDKEAQDKLRQTNQMVGKQRAMAAASGVAADAGSVLEIQQDTASLGILDAMTIKNNAYREAFGYKSQASSYDFQGQFAKEAGKNKANQTLVTGGLQAINGGLSSYYYMKGGPSEAKKLKET